MTLFLTDGAFWLVCAATLLSVFHPGRGLGRYALPLACAVALFGLLVPTRSVVSFGVSLLVLGIVYQLRPFRSALPLLGALLVNPFMRYTDALAGFELRLWLSEVAGRVLTAVGRSVEVNGNVLVLDGQPYSVDAECVGVHLLLTGLAAGFAILAVLEHRHGRHVRLPTVGLLLCLTLYGIILANLARILVLVWTGWPPEHPMHEVTGLACFGVFVLLPVGVLASTIFGRLGSWSSFVLVRAGGPQTRLRRSRRSMVGTALCTLLASGMLYQSVEAGTPVSAYAPGPINGQQPELRDNDVYAYNFDDAILYVKPIPAFYHAEHSPLICWRGSGYAFGNVRRSSLAAGDGEVYLGTLRRGTATLYTAWWMSNGDRATLEQSVWRTDMATGAPAYQLWNVSAGSEAELTCWVGELYGRG